MTEYQIIELTISLITAIGTCGTTILTLYFWLSDKKIKLGFGCMHADAYGSLPNMMAVILL